MARRESEFAFRIDKNITVLSLVKHVGSHMDLSIESNSIAILYILRLTFDEVANLSTCQKAHNHII